MCLVCDGVNFAFNFVHCIVQALVETKRPGQVEQVDVDCVRCQDPRAANGEQDQTIDEIKTSYTIR